MCRARTAKELEKLKSDVKNCFEAAAVSTRCQLKITEKMTYKGSFANRANPSSPNSHPAF